jgi:hypothetical protein
MPAALLAARWSLSAAPTWHGLAIDRFRRVALVARTGCSSASSLPCPTLYTSAFEQYADVTFGRFVGVDVLVAQHAAAARRHARVVGAVPGRVAVHALEPLLRVDAVAESERGRGPEPVHHGAAPDESAEEQQHDEFRPPVGSVL